MPLLLRDIACGFSVRIHPLHTGKYYSLNLSRLLEKFLFEVLTGI